MNPSTHIVLSAAARLYGPLIVLFALATLATQPPGVGVGFVAALITMLALTLHGLVFGAAAARAAAPPPWARALAAFGLIAALAGAGAPRLTYAPQLIEGGLYVLSVAGYSLILAVLIGRAPTLRDEGS